MAKSKTIYVCQSCGKHYSKWVGRCVDCGEWNSVAEEIESNAKPTDHLFPSQDKPVLLSEISQKESPRSPSGIEEFDRVLGGGVVPGSIVLLGGEPGIGKSTLLLQVAHIFSKTQGTVLYASGEESPSQISLRAGRLGLPSDKLLVYSENSLEKILDHSQKLRPGLLIIDSVQTLASEALESQPGSVGQLRECAWKIVNYGKSNTIPCFLVGHVTKEGAIAGPKVLEHMVDVVLYFENTSSQNFRILRAIKNRFGSTNEVGVFEIGASGLQGVKNPSALFLAERSSAWPGSSVCASLEGTRALLVEIQALASHTSLTLPRRTAIGVDANRVSLMVAILEKRAGFRFYDQDVYVNVAGGLRLTETACDLAITASLASSFMGKTIDAGSVFFGEVGLGGEVRSVPRAMERLKEAAQVGMKRAYLPEKTFKEIGKFEGLELYPVAHVLQLTDLIG